MQTANTTATQADIKRIPKTDGFPVLGSIPNVLNKQIDYLVEAWKQHGDIFELDLGAVSIIMLSHPDYAQHILRDNIRNYVKGGEIWESVRVVLGNGLVSSEGDYWRRQRRMMQPHFHRQHIQGLTNYMISAIEEIMDEWEQYAESGEAFNIAKAFTKVTMNVTMRTLFGSSISRSDSDMMGAALGYSWDYVVKNMVLGKLPDWMPVPGRKKFRENLSVSDEFLFRLIAQRRQDGKDGADLLAMLLNLVDEETGAELSNEEIRDEAATIFLAGYETTSMAMSWTVHLLMKHPEIMEKLCRDVDTILDKRIPSFNDLPQLAYSRMVMEEAMRLYPPVFWLPRTAVEDDVINGYPIKAGQMVASLQYTIHRHPDFWDEPEDFNPEHFAAENSKQRHSLAYIPFGAGQRQCIGRDFGMMEGTLILSRLIQRYKISPVIGREAKPAISTTLAIKDGVWVRLEKR